MLQAFKMSRSSELIANLYSDNAGMDIRVMYSALLHITVLSAFKSLAGPEEHVQAVDGKPWPSQVNSLTT